MQQRNTHDGKHNFVQDFKKNTNRNETEIIFVVDQKIVLNPIIKVNTETSR